MKRIAGTIVVALALVATGCKGIENISMHPVKVDAALLAQLHLPVYAGAKLETNQAMRVSTQSESVSVDTVSIVYHSSDTLDRVESWYDQRMPTGSKVVDFHLGGRGMATFQMRSADLVRRVSVVGAGAGTEIQLTMTHIAMPTPSSAASGR